MSSTSSGAGSLPFGQSWELLEEARIYDLGYPMFQGMPQSPRHPAFAHALVRRHGDQLRVDGTSSANDLVVMGTHVGTHIDALGHYSDGGRLFGGISAGDAQAGGRLQQLGVEEAPIFFRRGVLLDVPTAIGLDACPADFEITGDLLASTADAQGTPIQAGDVVLIATGWGRQFQKGSEAFLGWETGVPGVGAEGAEWLAEKGVAAAGAETIAFEYVRPGEGHRRLPAHRILIVQNGIYLFETMNLAPLIEGSVREFLFIASPLKLVGATGSPVRPLGVVFP